MQSDLQNAQTTNCVIWTGQLSQVYEFDFGKVRNQKFCAETHCLFMARPTDDLRQLLVDRARSREVMSKRAGVMLLFISVLSLAISAWSAWYLESKIQTNALWGLMGAYIVVLVLTIFYTSYNSIYSDLFLQSPSSVALKVREWHKKGYKLLTVIVIIEHILLFCSLPIVLFHSLGLSLSRCLFSKACTGITYSAWETVSMEQRTWVQKLMTRPVSVTLSTAQLAMFGCFIAVLATALIALIIYWYSEWTRRPSSDLTQSPGHSDTKPPTKSLYMMLGSSSLCVIFAIISLSVLKATWSVICLVLSLVSAWPLSQLHTISREPRITRLQFRKVSQRCLALLFIWLYICGTGIATSLSVNLPLYTVTSSGNSFLIIDSTSIAQLVCLLVFHLVFSCVSATGLYFHLSLMDILESYVKTDSEKEMPLADPVIVECPTPRQDSWITHVCASCSTNKNNTVLVPCGHSVICSECANALMGIPGFKCPLCCTEVFDSQRIS